MKNYLENPCFLWLIWVIDISILAVIEWVSWHWHLGEFAVIKNRPSSYKVVNVSNVNISLIVSFVFIALLIYQIVTNGQTMKCFISNVLWIFYKAIIHFFFLAKHVFNEWKMCENWNVEFGLFPFTFTKYSCIYVRSLCCSLVVFVFYLLWYLNRSSERRILRWY